MGHSAPGVDRNHYQHRSLERKRRAVAGIAINVTLADLTNGERTSADAKLVVPEAAE